MARNNAIAGTTLSPTCRTCPAMKTAETSTAAVAGNRRRTSSGVVSATPQASCSPSEGAVPWKNAPTLFTSTVMEAAPAMTAAVKITSERSNRPVGPGRRHSSRVSTTAKVAHAGRPPARAAGKRAGSRTH